MIIDRCFLVHACSKALSAVATWMLSRLVQVDVHLGMAKGFITSVTVGVVAINDDDWLLGNQIDSKSRVHLFLTVNEACISVVIILP